MPEILWNKLDLMYNGKYHIHIREAHNENDFNSILRLNRQAFPDENLNDDYAQKWIQHHRHQHYYVITLDDTTVVGYALWLVKCGYRLRLTCELDEIAVDLNYRRKGFAFYLIQISLVKFQYLQQQLLQMNCRIGYVYVITNSNNQGAQNLYKKALKVEQNGELIGASKGKNGRDAEEIMMANANMEIILDKLYDEYKHFLFSSTNENVIDK